MTRCSSSVEVLLGMTVAWPTDALRLSLGESTLLSTKQSEEHSGRRDSASALECK